MLSTDTILLNLKIISSIKENDKLKRNNDGNLSIDDTKPRILSSLSRFINRDCRERCIEDVNSIIDFSIERTNDIINSRFFSKNIVMSNIQDSFILSKMEEENYKRKNELQSIINDMKASIDGIINLKTTYKDDSTTVSKILIIISKTRSHCDTINSRFLKKND